MNVGNHLAKTLCSFNIRESTLEKDLMSALSINVLPFISIRDFTLVQGLISALIMGNPLLIIPPSLNTGEFTLEKGLMSAANVLPLTLPSIVIRAFTQ